MKRRGTTVLSFDEATGGSGLHSDISIGWRFNVLQSVTLEGLGWFDEHADGLQNAHTVGIWSPTGSLLVSSMVPAGTVAPLDGQFRTAAVAPIVLLPGNGYIVGGQSFAADAERLAPGEFGPRKCVLRTNDTIARPKSGMDRSDFLEWCSLPAAVYGGRILAGLLRP